MIRRPRRALFALALVAALPLAACSATVSMQPAAASNDPACAAVITRLPATADGQDRRWTDAQATGAWGDPADVLLTCGVSEPGPSELVCQSVDNVDWIIDDSEAPNYRFTTFGRSPAVEVYLDYDDVSARAVLSALGPAVGTLPTTGSVCTDRVDTPEPDAG
ncbi:DUF3515 domain-containing protein [Microbacterium sp. W1N]|uniref:DUF3515 domain-containing protein n=1 Tax=Microbacterium festucae TaxID=2977531 RepID=UPI0021BE31CC|nr:DUF3515 domain-containing protein [Microbacterium festucae]MCT9820341.1 DUF3515 domain-containing protein [Microbacterium festucae]